MSVKAWCLAKGISEHTYYYRLRKLRQAACSALEQARPMQLAEVPLSAKSAEFETQIRVTTAAGVLELAKADRNTLDQILRVLLHAE